MVDNGIVEKLMDLLGRHVEEGNVTVQHAALSALRNLAIPGKTWEGCNCVRNKICRFEKIFALCDLWTSPDQEKKKSSLQSVYIFLTSK